MFGKEQSAEKRKSGKKVLCTGSCCGLALTGAPCGPVLCAVMRK